MAIITEVQFAHEWSALADTLSALPDLEVRVIRETSTNPRESQYYIRVANVASSAIEDALAADRTVAEATAMPDLGGYQLWAVVFSDETELLAPLVTDHGGLVVDARATGKSARIRGWHERWLLPDREAIHDIWQTARDAGFAFDLLEFHEGRQADTRYLGLDTLTDEQRESLLAAYRAGYFAEPREASLEELGQVLDLSASAVGGRLKRGMKSLIGGTLVVDRPND